MQNLYERYKGLLLTLAYQLTGSPADAEDAVQDVFVKVHEVDPERLTEPKAYLCKMVTNRCLDLLKSARKRKEQYYGEWLPEPIRTSGEDGPLESVVRGQLLSYAMLVMLERLSPAERAVFVLREALEFDYADIARLVGKSEANCRKLISRARGKMGIGPDEPIAAEVASEQWVHRLLSALQQGNVDTVVSMLAEDAMLVSDGGGKAFSAVRPIVSPSRVARFLVGLVRIAAKTESDYRIELAELNGQPAVLIRSGGRIETAALFHVEGDAIRNVYFVRNPDKLQSLQ